MGLDIDFCPLWTKDVSGFSPGWSRAVISVSIVNRIAASGKRKKPTLRVYWRPERRTSRLQGQHQFEECHFLKSKLVSPCSQEPWNKLGTPFRQPDTREPQIFGASSLELPLRLPGPRFRLLLTSSLIRLLDKGLAPIRSFKDRPVQILFGHPGFCDV